MLLNLYSILIKVVVAGVAAAVDMGNVPSQRSGPGKYCCVEITSLCITFGLWPNTTIQQYQQQAKRCAHMYICMKKRRHCHQTASALATVMVMASANSAPAC